MSEYNNSAILFPNFKKKAAKHPDFTGSATVDGVKYDLSAWEKQGRRGKFFSLSFKPPQQAQAEPGRSPSPTVSAEHEPVPEEALDEQREREPQPFIA